MFNLHKLTSASGGSSRLKLAPDTVLKVSFMLEPQQEDPVHNRKVVESCDQAEKRLCEFDDALVLALC